ncbi:MULTISPECIES: GNAT family N-acetyltransferase [unclassified Pseudomonas]|uniref:GNAT family N-acetyltransferase n=1 Tax=unclassified Pseudomonas TaxID=196821 RepID=UPI001295504A|nr:MULTISPECIES: GNAT family N-acetyltransferase [unclassified Pseudomonas]MDU7558037.1 GNAT family N-acetyltransferase [Pseudomonas sp.]MQT41291.1 GNAT family N-acetyltransferase [Pseudomonas sp. FSL R10-0765]MQT53417.1 GNAT family N-acetyltransferase [Pseudomonas sp. FSL R10-2398]MQU00328.1 GNAT family N-acetyltransferase [Pseudomonas sp. FSL R10-2245]MQU13523.1 GNAT family N-acetyltransferase [Pseudomonas sp. FSL R10-2189]
MDCQIRSATLDDSAAISRVVIAALRGTNSQDYSPEIIAQVERSFAPEAVSALLGKRKVFVALLGETIAGTASLDGNVVRSVFVDPAHQGRGIGRLLMDVIHATAVSAGVGALRVPSSISAQSFYAALGYQTIRDEFYGAERTIIMEKPLAG